VRIACLLILSARLFAASDHDPTLLLADSRMLASPSELALVPSATSTVHRAKAGDWQFNLHSYVAWHQGKFWAVWSAGRVDEDSGQQRIHYATSVDGHHWSDAAVLVDDPDGPDGPALWIARGVFTQNGHLYALAAYNEGPRRDSEPRESWHSLDLVRFEWDGKSWRKIGSYVPNCMNNFPPHAFGDHLFMTCRDSYANMSTAIATGLNGAHWTVTKLPGDPPADRMSEPSEYLDPQGVAHLIFRDGRGSKYLFQSLSRDRGKSWTAPVRTNYPDATSKNITGRLSNGWYYLINNPDQKKRDPLGISFSRDGWTFSHPMALRKGAPERRYAGKSKGSGSFQYPHAIEHGGSLWVIYSTNKEDIEISEFKLGDFHVDK
jgi:hypothetical protein